MSKVSGLEKGKYINLPWHEILVMVLDKEEGSSLMVLGSFLKRIGGMSYHLVAFFICILFFNY